VAGTASEDQLPAWIDELADALEGELGSEDADTERFLAALALGLLPLAEVDVPEAIGHARTYVANFPVPGRALGDLDERAATWLAQLLDQPPARTLLREQLRQLAATWAESRPLAAEHVDAWASGPPPADPLQDAPWRTAMLALARTQTES
jgi:hypothetical protein